MSNAILNPIDLQNEAQFYESVKVYLGGHNQDCGMSQKPKKHPHVAIYLRVSTTDQTIESQLTKLRPWLMAEGYDVDECSLYVDEGVSAKSYPNFTDRPAGKQMMQDIHDGKIKSVYGYAVNRFFRRVAQGATWLDLMNNKYPHVMIKTTDCPFSAFNANGRMNWHCLLMVSEMENEQRAERTQSGMQRLQETLQKSSHAVFGWFWNEDDSRMNPCWHQQAVIKHVHDAWNDNKGQSFSAISRDLNGWGIKTATGKQWNQSAVRRLVKQPAKMQDQLHQFTPPRTFPINIKRGISPKATQAQ